MKLSNFYDLREVLSYVKPAELNLSETPHTFYFLDLGDGSENDQIYGRYPILPHVALAKTSGSGFITLRTIPDFIYSMIIRNCVEFCNGDDLDDSEWFFREGACIAYIVNDGILYTIAILIKPWRQSIDVLTSLDDIFKNGGFKPNNEGLAEAFDKFQMYVDKHIHEHLLPVFNQMEWNITASTHTFSWIISKIFRENIDEQTLKKFDHLMRTDHLEKTLTLIPDWSKAYDIFHTQFSKMERVSNIMSPDGTVKKMFLTLVKNLQTDVARKKIPFMHIIPFTDYCFRCIILFNHVRWSGHIEMNGNTIVYIGPKDYDILNTFNDVKHIDESNITDVLLLFVINKLKKYTFSDHKIGEEHAVSFHLELPKNFKDLCSFYRNNKLFCRTMMDGLVDVDIQDKHKMNDMTFYLKHLMPGVGSMST